MNILFVILTISLISCFDNDMSSSNDFSNFDPTGEQIGTNPSDPALKSINPNLSDKNTKIENILQRYNETQIINDTQDSEKIYNYISQQYNYDGNVDLTKMGSKAKQYKLAYLFEKAIKDTNNANREKNIDLMLLHPDLYKDRGDKSYMDNYILAPLIEKEDYKTLKKLFKKENDLKGEAIKVALSNVQDENKLLTIINLAKEGVSQSSALRNFYEALSKKRGIKVYNLLKKVYTNFDKIINDKIDSVISGGPQSLLEGALTANNNFDIVEDILNNPNLLIDTKRVKEYIYYAAAGDDVKTLKLISQKLNFEINDKNINEGLKYGDSILHQAARKKSLAILKYLIEEKGFNLNIKNAKKQTPLHIAAACGNHKILKYMINNDNSLINEPDAQNKTVLHLIASNLESQIDPKITKKIAEYLISKGADKKLLDINNKTAYDIYMENEKLFIRDPKTFPIFKETANVLKG